MAEECTICQAYTPLMTELHDTYASEQISFVGLFPNRFSKKETIELFKEKYNLPFPLKREYFQTKTKKFGAEITPEVVVFNESTETILYKGRIDNMFVRIGKRRTVVTENELQMVLSQIKENVPISVEQKDAIGCYIKLEK